MARPAALGPIQATTARQMRHTAGLLDADHPETIAGDHVRDAAKVLEHGSTDGAKRHLDAAMGLLTPQNLVRHGIRDDEGHATAKHHMHQIHRHHLNVQDIEDTRARNEQLREALRSSREQIRATTQQAVAGPPQPGHMPPGYQQPSKAVTALAVELAPAWLTERRGLGGKWIGSANAASLHGQVLHGRDRRFRPVHGRYDHATRTITDATRGKVPVSEVAKTLPVERRRRTVLPARYQVAGSLATPTDLSARTALLERTPAPRGRPGGPGLYHVKGLGHTPYLQQVVKALIEERGMPPGKAYAIARARIRKWSATSKHPEVRAAAGRAEAGEIARQGRGHAHAISSWDVADTLIELAFHPDEPRNERGEWMSDRNKALIAQIKANRKRRLDAAAGRAAQPVVRPQPAKPPPPPRRGNTGYVINTARKGTLRRYGSGDLLKALASPHLANGTPEAEAAYQSILSELVRRGDKLPLWAQEHTVTWSGLDTLIELACEPIDLFNPYHAPTGQFTTSSGAGAAQGKQTPRQKRQKLLKRAASLRSQIRGLETQLHAATAAHRKSRSSVPAKKGAAATSAKQARKARQTAAKARKTTAKAKPQAMSPATIRAKIAVLRGQLQATLAQLKRL